MTATVESLPTIAVFGASGVIGEATASWLSREGFPVVAVARRFTPAQKQAFGKAAIESPIARLEAPALAQLLRDKHVDIIVNCLGVLQDTSRGKTDEVHRRFVERIVALLGGTCERRLLIQLSIPGEAEDDRTPFSRTKREAERLIQASGIPFVILRPGFVVAAVAYGGGALVRALAALPFALPAREAGCAFATTDVIDIARTIAHVVRRWRDGERNQSVVWEVMAREKASLAEVIDSYRCALGRTAGLVGLPSWLLSLAAKAGDLVSHLGWLPPIRSTALAEMRRGVTGNPRPWIAATGIEPLPLAQALLALPIHVQERWFARLYLIKPLILATLVLFWCLSGLIALTVASEAATAILVVHGFSAGLARGITLLSSLTDLVVGVAIAIRRTCRLGLLAGIAISLFYMAGAAAITPELWIEPLGALVKTGPAIVLMLVALAILEDR